MLVLGTLGYFGYRYLLTDYETVDAVSLIPEDAIFILEAEEPIENWKKFSNSSFWQFLKTHPYLEEVTADADYLDTLISENSFLLKNVGNRNFYMSAHMTKRNDYDYLFLVDLKKASKLNLLSLNLEKYLKTDDYTISNSDYNSHNIVQLFDKESRDMLYLTQLKNYLVCSYTKKLVHNSIDQLDSNTISNDAKYKQVYNRVDDDGIARIYLQYAFVDEYMSIYTSGNEDALNQLSSTFSYTSLDMELADDEANMSGYTSIVDSTDSYVTLLQNYGNASLDFADVISSRAAYAQVIALNDFKDFYSDLLKLRSDDPESIKEYNEVKNKVEKLLGLNLEKDILAWIGNEIVLAQNNPSELHRNEDDLVVAVKAYNADFAREKLTLIQKQIKRRTPARFKKMSFKNYDIYYLDIKGFFNLFFGKAFKKLTKPYYTIVDDFILFSNSPKTLVSLIEDYENGNVLSKYELFNKASENIPRETALFTYINGVYSYKAFEKNVKASELANYKKNKPYFNYFKTIGISYTAVGEGFENKVYMHFNQDEVFEEPPPLAIDSLANELLEDYSEELKKLTDAEDFVLSNVEDGLYTKYYKGTEIAHLKAETKNEKFHGDFKEYYPNGKIRSEGKYRKGRKTGRWKYYDKEGNLSEKEWEGF